MLAVVERLLYRGFRTERKCMDGMESIAGVDIAGHCGGGRYGRCTEVSEQSKEMDQVDGRGGDGWPLWRGDS